MKARVFILLFLLIQSIAAYAAQTEKLVFAMDVIRHGDRTPLFVIPKAPHDWPQGLGQLTARGMQQEYQLGVNARNNYITHSNLLSSSFNTDTIYVRSTDVDRTLMSAESFLLGLYPLGTGPELKNSSSAALPGTFQPIPIHTVPKEYDTTLNATTESPAFKALVKEYVYTTPEWKAKTAELKPKFAAWGQILGLDIDNLDQFISIGNTLYINQLYHVALPAGLSQEDANLMIETGHFAFVSIFKNPIIGKASGGPLLKSICDDLQAASDQKTHLKYKLISGHDTNLLGVMSAMGAPLKEAPRYASDLNIELVTADNHSYTVKVQFNNEPVNIPACGGSTCTLNQFISLAN